ncbi:MAG TPA: hypothetical protein VFO16_18735 [Pseudonocardiaceae bacterium]|nr:hypothetical protein [Pseudonocardiaceae bacterium]
MRIRVLSFLLLSLAILMVTTVPPAQATPADAMAACRSGAPGHMTTLQISGDTKPLKSLTALSPSLAPGDVYRVTVTGKIKVGGWPWDPSYTAEGAGWSNRAPSDGYWPQPGLPKYGLIASWVGLPNWYWLGASSLCIQWTGSTNEQALMEMNDENPVDNSGTWIITFHQYPAA